MRFGKDSIRGAAVIRIPISVHLRWHARLRKASTKYTCERYCVTTKTRSPKRGASGLGRPESSTISGKRNKLLTELGVRVVQGPSHVSGAV